MKCLHSLNSRLTPFLCCVGDGKHTLCWHVRPRCKQKPLQTKHGHQQLHYDTDHSSTSCQAAGFCFDVACQREKDVLFTLSIALPVILAAAAFFLFGRKDENEEVFESRGGVAFRSRPGVQPMRDKDGKLAYRAVSYTPWPVEEGTEGKQLRIDVGPVNRTEKETYVFDRVLQKESEVLAVTLPRPMGVIFEEDARAQRVVVADLVEGSPAHQRAQVAKMDTRRRQEAVLCGDVLRACTCTNFVYQDSALFGAKAPTRTIVMYGADKQKWTQVMGALKKGDKADGGVTLILERPL